MRRFLFVLLILAIGVLPAAAQGPGTSPGALAVLLRQAMDQPDDFSMACRPLRDPQGAVQYHANVRFPLASVAKLLIFIEFARQVEAGTLTLDEGVDLATLDLYNVPRSNSDAHQRFMDDYAAGRQVLNLWEIASVGMIQYSSNAASDYVLDRLGPTDWDALFQTLQLTATDPPHSMSAIALLMTNHDTGRATPSRVETLTIDKGEALFDRYLTDAGWHRAEVDYRSNSRGGGSRGLFPTWEVQAAILDRLTAKGTASDFLRVMAAIYDSGGPLSARTKQLVRDGLRWRGNAYVDAMYLEYGSKLGFYSGGLLALVVYGHPYAGDPVISAVFLRNIPRQTYNEMQDGDSIGELAHWMNLNACAGLLNGLLMDLPPESSS